MLFRSKGCFCHFIGGFGGFRGGLGQKVVKSRGFGGFRGFSWGPPRGISGNVREFREIVSNLGKFREKVKKRGPIGPSRSTWKAFFRGFGGFLGGPEGGKFDEIS